MALRLFVLLAALSLLLTSREPPWADSHAVYDTTQALVTHGQLSVAPSSLPWFYAHRNGRTYGVFPLGNVVAMVPSFLLYEALAPIHALPREPLFALTCHFSPALMMAGACALFFLACRRRGAGARMAVLLTLCLGLCTLCFIYGRSPYAEAVQTLSMMLLCERTLAQGERLTLPGMAWVGAAAGMLFNSKLVYALVLPLPPLYLAGAHLVVKRDTGVRRFLAGCAVALLAFLPLFAAALWHNWLKTGSVLDTGYRSVVGGTLFSGDLPSGLYGLLLSSGKGMFWYSPPLVLGLLGLRTSLRRLPLESWFLLSVIAVVLLFNGQFPGWHGDYCWGPRHVTSITPLLLLLAVPWLPEALERGHRRLRRAALAALLLLGLGVQLLGASLYWDHYIRILLSLKDQTGAPGWFQHQVGHGHFMPYFSPLRGHVWLLRHMARGDADLDRDAPWKSILPQRADFTDTWHRLRIDWWALDWFSGPHRAVGAGVIILGLLAGTALAAGASLRHLAGEVRVVRVRQVDVPLLE